MTTIDIAEPRTPNPIDKHVGARIRLRRKILGMSQVTLADALGLTFQQVQKYERGDNRISASKMYEAARCLGVTTSYFFEGLGDNDSAETMSDPQAVFFAIQGADDLAKVYRTLPAEKRAALIGMVRSFADAVGTEAAA